MAPNAEEELLVVKPWGPQPEKVCQCVLNRKDYPDEDEDLIV